MLPWRELGFDIETVNLRDGNVDLQHLEQILIQEANRSVKIGSFSAVSNLTGIIADDLAITAILHKYGALSVWDYATGASYMNMNMNPTHPDYPDPSLITKDAIVFSGHKILGGVGTPVSLLFAPINVPQALHPRQCRDRKLWHRCTIGLAKESSHRSRDHGLEFRLMLEDPHSFCRDFDDDNSNYTLYLLNQGCSSGKEEARFATQPTCNVWRRNCFLRHEGES